MQQLIAVARQKLAGDAVRLKAILGKSRKLLAPLEEPFDVDLGCHRWLNEEREESYSDWLEWVICQAGNPARVFQLFDLGSPPNELISEDELHVQRECCVPHGCADQEGRLDLVIRFGNKAIIVVEIKKIDADEADTAKQQGYNQWLAMQNHPCKRTVLVAAAGQRESCEECSKHPGQRKAICPRVGRALNDQ